MLTSPSQNGKNNTVRARCDNEHKLYLQIWPANENQSQLITRRRRRRVARVGFAWSAANTRHASGSGAWRHKHSPMLDAVLSCVKSLSRPTVTDGSGCGLVAGVSTATRTGAHNWRHRCRQVPVFDSPTQVPIDSLHCSPSQSTCSAPTSLPLNTWPGGHVTFAWRTPSVIMYVTSPPWSGMSWQPGPVAVEKNEDDANNNLNIQQREREGEMTSPSKKRRKPRAVELLRVVWKRTSALRSFTSIVCLPWRPHSVKTMSPSPSSSPLPATSCR